MSIQAGLTTVNHLLELGILWAKKRPDYPQKKKEILYKMKKKASVLEIRFKEEKELDEFDHDALPRIRRKLRELEKDVNDFMSIFIKEIKS